MPNVESCFHYNATLLVCNRARSLSLSLRMRGPRSPAQTSILHLQYRFGCLSPSGRKRQRKDKYAVRLADLRKSKNEDSRRFRQARRNGASKEEITSAARRFHQLMREHSKLKALQTRHNVKQSASVSNKRCSRNFWKFS